MPGVEGLNYGDRVDRIRRLQPEAVNLATAKYTNIKGNLWVKMLISVSLLSLDMFSGIHTRLCTPEEINATTQHGFPPRISES